MTAAEALEKVANQFVELWNAERGLPPLTPKDAENLAEGFSTRLRALGFAIVPVDEAARQMPALRWEGGQCLLGHFVVGRVDRHHDGAWVGWLEVDPHRLKNDTVRGSTEPEARTAVEAAVRKELGLIGAAPDPYRGAAFRGRV